MRLKYLSCNGRPAHPLTLPLTRIFMPVVMLFIMGLSPEALAQTGAASIRWNDALDQEPDWYASAEAVRIADNVLAYQDKSGGWPKNIDMARPLSEEDRNRIRQEQAVRGATPGNITIDNGATHSQMRYLARTYNATGHTRFKEGFLRGIDYLLAAQYDNGGWPQYYPIREGYYEQITFNDGAMVGVLEILRDIGMGDPAFAFLDAQRRTTIAAAFNKGVDSILRMQVVQHGRRTVWCAQHDKSTLEPAWARAYEPPSLSGGESVGIVRFLMSIEEPTPEIIAAIEGAIAWLENVAIYGYRLEEFTDIHGEEDKRVVQDPGAGPLWARFYELGTNRPLFLDRDSVFRYALSEISQERRGGYDYYGSWARRLLAEEYPLWKSKHNLSGAVSPRNTVEEGAQQKPRVIVLTDIENEPDDAQSMVRLLTYSNQFDIEGLVATTSVHMQENTAAWRIKEIVEAYGEVRGNLNRHEAGYPATEHLLSVIREGRRDYGMQAVGEGQDSPGSELLIERVDINDPRPVWVVVWGGPNVLAQALWKVRATRTPEALATFVSKLRVYTISDQDDSGPWIRKSFPDLFYICSPGFHPGGAYHHATWSGISGDIFWGRFVGADFSIVDNPWLDAHVRSKGALGAQYPHTKYLMEGDTPSFLNLIDNGLSNPERPDWGGWGGRYERYTPRMKKWFLEPETRPFWTDAVDEIMGADGNWHTTNKATLWRWRSAYQNDFAARMAWSVTPEYGEANHPPVPALDHAETLSARPGERVQLSAAGSTDPDGDPLNYSWFYYPEAGTITTARPRTGMPVEIHDADKAKAWFTVPVDRVMPPGTGTMHIILAVTDGGMPPLTRYRRVIITVVP